MPALEAKQLYSKPMLDDQTRHALSRARWVVIQTGLITTGLVAFGLYVLGSRIEHIHFLYFYVFTWIPLGAITVGALAASGYAMGSWWTGVPIRGSLLATILMLQIGAYVLA